MTDVLPNLPLNHGFPPIVGNNAKTLILGSMPGIKSLQEQQYYAHPRNAFWPIISSLLSFENTLAYAEKVQFLIHHRIAVWDVLNACVRPGSLDSNIDNKTSIPNDFNCFFQKNPDITLIIFNGGKAESVFMKSVLPDLEKPFSSIAHLRMPSTSPAHASVSFEQKQQQWYQALIHHKKHQNDD